MGETPPSLPRVSVCSCVQVADQVGGKGVNETEGQFLLFFFLNPKNFVNGRDIFFPFPVLVPSLSKTGTHIHTDTPRGSHTQTNGFFYLQNNSSIFFFSLFLLFLTFFYTAKCHPHFFEKETKLMGLED